nr:MAG TPA: SEC-C motif-c motif containing protein, Structural [Caudoviricetes sp.]
MNYALVENGTVVNIIWLNERNAGEWPGAVRLGERMVEMGDTYEDGRWFYRDGTEVLTAAEEAQMEAAQYAAALQVLGVVLE